MTTTTATMADLRSDESRRDADLRRLGLWMFLATVTMLFAAFTSAYVVRRSGSDWQRVSLPPTLWLNTVILMASSLVLEGANWFGSRRHWRASSVAFIVALVLGVGFLVGQAVAWRQLVAVGVYLPSNPFASFFYMMTGAHAVHIVAALAVIAWGMVTTMNGSGRRQPRRWDTTMGVCRTFWHYLGGVWLFLFLLLSVY